MTAARVAGQTPVLFVPRPRSPPSRSRPTTSAAATCSADRAADVSRIEILRGRGRLVLARRDGIWWLSEPIADLAERGRPTGWPVS